MTIIFGVSFMLSCHMICLFRGLFIFLHNIRSCYTARRLKNTQSADCPMNPHYGGNPLKIHTPCQIFSKDNKTVADEFNRFFVSVGQSSVDKIQSLANEDNVTLNQNCCFPKECPLCKQFHLNTIGSGEIEHIISLMPSNKAPGIDQISVHVFTDCLALILPVE